MQESSGQLPNTWSLERVAKVLSVQYGKGLPARNRVDRGKFIVYGSNGAVGRHDEALTDGPALIIGRKGGAGEVHLATDPCWPIDTTYYAYPRPGISIKYLELRSLDRSTAVPSLSRDDLNAQFVPIPPTAEQLRIVDEIETQFTRLDTAVADLRRLQHNLDRYRASVLKAAFEGRLVPQDPDDEPAQKLLERIRAARNGDRSQQLSLFHEEPT